MKAQDDSSPEWSLVLLNNSSRHILISVNALLSVFNFLANQTIDSFSSHITVSLCFRTFNGNVVSLHVDESDSLRSDTLRKNSESSMNLIAFDNSPISFLKLEIYGFQPIDFKKETWLYKTVSAIASINFNRLASKNIIRSYLARPVTISRSFSLTYPIDMWFKFLGNSIVLF